MVGFYMVDATCLDMAHGYVAVGCNMVLEATMQCCIMIECSPVMRTCDEEQLNDSGAT